MFALARTLAGPERWLSTGRWGWGGPGGRSCGRQLHSQLPTRQLLAWPVSPPSLCLGRAWARSYSIRIWLEYFLCSSSLKKKCFNNFNWRLITILWWFWPYIHINQPWVSMCPSSRTPLPPPSASHPSGSSQCTGFECPVSCIELALVIYFTYGNIHVSMLFSQIIPPSPSPTEFKSLFFVSLLLSRV